MQLSFSFTAHIYVIPKARCGPVIDLNDILNDPFPGYITLKSQFDKDLEVRLLRLFEANGREHIMLQPKELEEQGGPFPYRLLTDENGSVTLSPSRKRAGSPGRLRGLYRRAQLTGTKRRKPRQTHNTKGGNCNGQQ